MFGEIPQNVVRPEKSHGELRPFLSERARKDYEKAAGHEMAPKNFNVWVVQTEATRSRSLHTTDALTKEFQSSLSTDQKPTSGDRTVSVSVIPQNELRHALPNTFPGYGEVAPNLLPDLVIVSGDMGYHDASHESSLTRAYINFEMQAIRDIRHAADATLHSFFPTGEKLTSDWDQEFLQYHVLGETYHDLVLKKNTVGRNLAIKVVASSLFNKTDHEWKISGQAFDEYARTGDDHKIHKILTLGRIQWAVQQATKSYVVKDRLLRYQSQKNHGEENDEFSSESEFLEYQRVLSEHIRVLSTGTNLEQLREEVFLEFKKIIDEKKQAYLSHVESTSTEEQLLQPLIISVGKSQKYREASLVAGADATLPELSPEDMKKLVELAKRIRTSPASMATDRLRRNKSEFYHSVVDQIEDRSKETADTEKELLFLSSLFKKVGAAKILDVGCGYGRLARPLAKQGFEVTGIDASRKLLTKAKEMKGKTKNLHYTKGDIIDYKQSVTKESFDAIYYGWHSFLEAYGLGNALASLQSARHALKPGGIIAFDQPSRTNPGLEEGWYGDADHGYLAYLMNEEEIQFMLRLAGFEDVNILHWTTKPSTLYPEGMQKITVVARKPAIIQPKEELQKAP